jgi:hypothetical protein
MSQVDEGLIHAWLDGQLPADDASRVERLVASDAEWAAAAAEARGLVAGASRILGALDHVPSAYAGGHLERNAPHRPSVSRVSWGAPWVRAAAAVVLVAGISSVVWMRMPQNPTSTRDRDTPGMMPGPASPSASPPAPSAPTGVGAETGARGEVKQTTSPAGAGAAVADSGFAARVARSETQPDVRVAVRRDTMNLRADDTARARAANELIAGRAAPVTRPAPLVEHGVVGALSRVTMDSPAKALGEGAIDALLAGCWIQIDSTPLPAEVARQADPVGGGGGGRGGRAAGAGRGGATGADARGPLEREEARRTVVVYRFIAPVATDLIAAARPPAPPAASPIPLTARAQESLAAPVPVLMNAQTRLLQDSSYVAEFVDARGRTELAFTVTGDTLRGRSRLTSNTVALPERMFVAVRTACPQ